MYILSIHFPRQGHENRFALVAVVTVFDFVYLMNFFVSLQPPETILNELYGMPWFLGSSTLNKLSYPLQIRALHFHDL